MPKLYAYNLGILYFICVKIIELHIDKTDKLS